MEPLKNQHTDHKHQHRDDEKIKFPPAPARDRLAKIDLFGALNSFRRQFESPCEDKRDRKAKNHQHHERLHYPFRSMKGRQHGRTNLDNKPANYRVRDRDLVNIPPLQLGKEVTRVHFGFSSQSFWKRGSLRSGSNMGSSRSSAGVSGTFSANAPWLGTESSFCKAAMARSGSFICATTRARISSGRVPADASFSIGTTAIARSARANAAALSPRATLVSARSPIS